MFELLSILMPFADTHVLSPSEIIKRRKRKAVVETHEMSEAELRRSHAIRTIPHNVDAQKYYLKHRKKMLRFSRLTARRAKKWRTHIIIIFSLINRTRILEVIDAEVADILEQLRKIEMNSLELVAFYEKFDSEEKTDPFDASFRKNLSILVTYFSGNVLAFEYTLLRFSSFASVEKYKQKVFEHMSSSISDKEETFRKLLTGLSAFVVFMKTVLNKNAALVDEITKFLNEGEYKESRERSNKYISTFNEKVEFYLSQIPNLDRKYFELMSGLEEHKNEMINPLLENLLQIRKIIQKLHTYLRKYASSFNSNNIDHIQKVNLKMYVQYLSEETTALQIKSKQLKQTLTEINPFFVGELKMLLVNTSGLIRKFKEYMEMKNII